MIGGSTSYFSTPPVVDAGGIALVQSASGTTADGSAGLTVNFGVPCTAGNSVLALISYFDAADSNPTVDAVGGGAGSLVADVQVGQGTPTRTGIFRDANVTGGETGISLVTSEVVRANNIIAEYSGLADAAAEDTATNTATSTTLAIGTITPTSANNLLTAIFAFNADVTAVGIANDVLVTGIGAGVYTCRGQSNGRPYFSLLGEPDNEVTNAISYGNEITDTWSIWGVGGSPDNNATTTGEALPWQASWTGSTVTEIPGWELVGTRTGGASVYEYVYEKIQTTATPSNPTIVLSGSADIAGAGACFGGVA